MKLRIAIFSLSLAIVPASVSGQTKTITNADLEKYRQKRLAAEKELRENYREMGFPSPEELEKRNAESARELSRRAETYRRHQLERERNRVKSTGNDQVVYYYQGYDNGFNRYPYYGLAPAYLYGGSYYRRGSKRFFPRFRFRRPPIKRRGPGFIRNPYIRQTWRRQSAPMRRTYRGNFPTRRVRRN